MSSKHKSHVVAATEGGPIAKSASASDAGRAFSGRPTTVRFSTQLQKRLTVAAEISGKSVSELMREGAEHIVDQYLGADEAEVAQAIQYAAETSAQRMRELYGLDGDN